MSKYFKMLTKSVLYIFILTNYIPWSSATTLKKLYEQQCSVTEDCDQSQGLTCQNKACRCEPGGATVYSLSNNRCVGSAGRECVQQNNATFCVVNSLCHDYGYMHLCTCKDGYYQSKDGNCYTVAKYGETCLEEDFSCGDTLSSSISCIEKKCGCVLGEENQSFDPKENKCTSFAGGQCIPHYYQPCSGNSYCGEFNENIGAVSFMAGYRCLCSPGHSRNVRSKQCLARYGTQCGANSPCNFDEYLGCLNGKCQCRNPLNEIFNELLQQCTILVGSTCKLEDSKKCVDHAICTAEKNSTSKHGRCQCGPGYSTTPSNTCLLDINQKCEPGQCNFYNGLACVNDTCNCIDSYLSYDKVSKSCVSLVGHPCGSITLLNEDKDKEIVILCEANATCAKGATQYNGASKRVCKASTGAKTN